jgi:hypothetical protein
MKAEMTQGARRHRHHAPLHAGLRAPSPNGCLAVRVLRVPHGGAISASRLPLPAPCFPPTFLLCPPPLAPPRPSQAELARVQLFAEHIRFCANKFEMGVNLMPNTPNYDRVVEMQVRGGGVYGLRYVAMRRKGKESVCGRRIRHLPTESLDAAICINPPHPTPCRPHLPGDIQVYMVSYFSVFSSPQSERHFSLRPQHPTTASAHRFPPLR